MSNNYKIMLIKARDFVNPIVRWFNAFADAYVIDELIEVSSAPPGHAPETTTIALVAYFKKSSVNASHQRVTFYRIKESVASSIVGNLGLNPNSGQSDVSSLESYLTSDLSEELCTLLMGNLECVGINESPLMTFNSFKEKYGNSINNAPSFADDDGRVGYMEINKWANTSSEKYLYFACAHMAAIVMPPNNPPPPVQPDMQGSVA